MTKWASAAFGVLAGTIMVVQPARAVTLNDPADVAAITKIEQNLAVATKMSSIIDYYAPTAIVYDIFYPGIYNGKKEIYAAFQKQFDGVSYVTSQIPELNIATDGKFACAAMQVTTQTKSKDGTPFDLTVRQIDAYKKIGGKWLIVQEHLSVPADKATGMAVWKAPVVPGGPLVWPANPPFGPATTPERAKEGAEAAIKTGAYSTSIDQLMDYFGPDDYALVFDNYTPGVMHGKKAIRDYYNGVMGTIDHVTDDFTSFHVDSDGAFAIEMNTQNVRFYLAGGKEWDMSFRESDCMRLVNGQWYTFYEMNSYPVDLKTGKSVTQTPGAFK
jgi:ketosteroid isomerase-like protein